MGFSIFVNLLLLSLGIYAVGARRRCRPCEVIEYNNDGIELNRTMVPPRANFSYSDGRFCRRYRCRCLCGGYYRCGSDYEYDRIACPCVETCRWGNIGQPIPYIDGVQETAVIVGCKKEMCTCSCRGTMSCRTVENWCSD